MRPTLAHVERIWGLLSAVGIALYFGIGWLIHTDEMVRTTFPKHVVSEEERLNKLTEIQLSQQDILKAQQEDKLIAQLGQEAECEDPKTTYPRDYCQSVLREKRLREAHERSR